MKLNITKLLAVSALAISALVANPPSVVGGDLITDNLTVLTNTTIHGNLTVANSASIATNALRCSFRFSTNSAPLVYSESGVSWTGRVNGAVYNTSGYVGGCHSFDGNSDNYITNGAMSTIGAQFTVTAWIKSAHRNLGAGQEVIALKTTANRTDVNCPWILGLDQSMKLCAANEGAWKFSSDTSITTGTWNHVAYSCNGTNLFFYVNGQSAGSVPFTFTNDQHYVFIGTRFASSVNEHWNGDLDEVLIYSRALPQSEIQSLYEYTDQQSVARFNKGIIYTAPLGDLQMGTYTNQP